MIIMFWGGMFFVVQYVVSFSGLLFFVGLCFVIVVLVVGLFLLCILCGLMWLEVKVGVVIGVVIVLGYGLQIWGLQIIFSSKFVFIIVMYVLLVLLLQWLCLGCMLGVMFCVGIVLVFIGLILLVGLENNLLVFGVGEMIILVSVVVIVVEIIFISVWVGKVDVCWVMVVQLVIVLLVVFVVMKLVGELVLLLMLVLFGVVLGLGIFSVIIQVIMNWVQCSVLLMWVIFIYIGELVWVGIFGWLVGECLLLLVLFGCVLIFVGVLVSELKWKCKLLLQVFINDDVQLFVDLVDCCEL